MKCKQCGSELHGQEKFCANCGKQLSPDIDLWDDRANSKRHVKSKQKIRISGRAFRNIVFSVLGAILIIISIISSCYGWTGNYGSDAMDVFNAATNMENIASISGDTIAEAFYQNMGTILLGIYSIMLDITSTLMDIWFALNHICLFGGLVILNIGVSGLLTSHQKNKYGNTDNTPQ